MGGCADFYRLIRAARYLGVAPWDLARQASTWLDWAEAAMSAEAAAERAALERTRRR